ncbi:transcription regulator [Anticarsia gemmatalis nucleopolyhedrovirus]|uniref:Transcription regulator n=1 Tax=Anticarsia gemmatalis multiple nucleopolyhedrovirus TaxID=268591 RepID=A0A0S3IXW0_9ABAC|nr:transcription regulator [Anticarsia gemmatalis nucleopolyhedrovirus]ABI13828.1 transcription regulator [Anticarsia gemmatalis multiple nucleopolyhedrovirus]ALR69924.1 transcription regulator [Anticarsia gemmatalis multiple nucleopolyhedrovirus]ALR70082.1 transcription regulator [Anticarsia gemmatalis multiple nucleopolyhedrovirus]ALR70239.1 transcription regulator [Anticarsia gemmatalis multiple nucleopolyhedrovirus]ALR70866.1 transcription regulator [Anticarsia gemmatalis multiple nucleopo
MFAQSLHYTTQFLPEACRAQDNALLLYNLHISGVDVQLPRLVTRNVQINSEGFVRFVFDVKVFQLEQLKHVTCATPDDIDDYVDVTRPELSAHDAVMFKLVCRDRWYKGDADRLRRILQQPCVTNLIKFACNVMWERGYENHYTLGQQLSILITTKLIQSGLDFKHQPDVTAPTSVRGWDDPAFEKHLASISSISEIIKRHVFSKKYICLEVAAAHWRAVVHALQTENFQLVLNAHTPNVLLVRVDDDKNSMLYLRKLAHLLQERVVNLLFVTDVEYYMRVNNFMFYLYNSLKFYYYCLKNKYAFESTDKTTLFLLYIIISLEWFNKGHLNSFTLEKSALYNPLELSTRRLNSIKRAAQQNRVVECDSEINIDYIRGKRVRTGTHYGQRIVQLE